MPVTDEEKQQFRDRWIFPISSTFDVNIKLPDLIQSFKKVADEFYFSRARMFELKEKFLYRLRAIRKFGTDEIELKFWNHPLTKTLFGIWSENIYGVKRGWMADSREGVEFYKYIIENLKVVHDPKYSQLYENYQNLAFGLKLLRPNPQAHIYLSYNFIVRPLKKMIKDFFRMAAISGDYEILMRRFPPYHFMLKLNAAPGERTFIDAKGLDFPPITYRLDLKFSTAIKLNKVQTRSNDRFITCPVISDPYLEAEKKAEVDKLEAELAKTPFNYFSSVEYGEDGKIYYLDGKGGKEEITMFGPRRQGYIANKDLLNLIKAIPRPSSESGLIIRFNLLNPITVLIEGINSKRELTLDEVFTAWKCLDILEGEIRKPEKDRRAPMAVINDVLANPNAPGVKETTLSFIKEINRLKASDPNDPTEEDAWRFLIARLNEGKGRNILQAICNRFMGDGFDLVFSLWPLITGNEIKLTPSGDLEIKEAESKKNLLPLLEYLRRELEELLKKVFTLHLDISAATNRFRSEPMLAGMIVEHCINVKSNEAKFKKKLEQHLKDHYQVHRNFLTEYLKEGAPTVLYNIHKLKIDWDKQIASDVEGILDLIKTTRSRLYSPTLCNRLLCFIDPYSIEVQIGNFIYEGKGLKEEEDFIKSHEERQFILAEEHSKKKLEVEKFDIERKGNKQILDFKLAVMKAKEAFAIEETESEKRKKEAELRRVISEAKYNAIESLKAGNIKDYALLSLIKAHHDGGIKAVEEILHDSHNLIMAISPELHHHQEMHHMKDQLLKIAQSKPEIINNPLVMAMLLSKDFKDIVAADIYKEINTMLGEILKGMRYGFPFFPGGGMRGLSDPSEKTDESKPKDKPSEKPSEETKPGPKPDSGGHGHHAQHGDDIQTNQQDS